MKRFKRVLVAGTAAATLLASTFSVSAANLKDIFDAGYYADSYKDLKEAFGDDEEQLYQHFLSYGLDEERNMSPILDVVAYREAYPDLDAAFGDDWDAYVNHFFTYGAYEMRDKGVLFNPVIYAAAYSDVAEAYGDDLLAITQHYLTYGRAENRTVGTANGYADIATAKQASQAASAAAQTAGRLHGPSVVYGSYGGRTEYKYDGRGNRIETIYYDSNGNVTYHSYFTYNSNDDLVYEEYRDADGNLQNYAKNEYDGRKLQKSTYYDGSGNVTGYGVYEWNGNQAKVSWYAADDTMTNYTEFAVDGHYNTTTASYYDAKGNFTGSSASTYDGNDNLLTYVNYDADGKEAQRYTYTYYANNVTRTSAHTYYYGGQARTEVYEYNENGSQISSASYTDGKLTGRYAYEYSAEGPVAKATFEYYDADGALENKGVYVYDAQHRVVESYSYDKDGVTVTGTTNYTYQETDYGYDQIGKYESADGYKSTTINMYSKEDTYLGYKYANPNGSTVECWYNVPGNWNEGITQFTYNADGKLTRKEIKDSSWSTTAAYEYDADGTEVALVQDQYGNWVRPENVKEPDAGSDEPDNNESGSNEGDTPDTGSDTSQDDTSQGTVSGGDLTVSGGDAGTN